MEEGQLPDWLVSLREQQLSGKPAEAEQPTPDWLTDLRGQRPEPQPEAGSPSPISEPPPDPAIRPDLLGDLRQQIVLAEAEEARPKRRSGGVAGLKPYQRFVLALLLFLEVAICGCLLLVLTERVVF